MHKNAQNGIACNLISHEIAGFFFATIHFNRNTITIGQRISAIAIPLKGCGCHSVLAQP